ncbi:hypothetical protein Misp06_03324 [Microbulbifer sp. NBRC 101763]|uniref:hypothetical protein n=1 Tax=unclassified Microbulbifer TaxID=2619833 RepID=UPI0024AD7147|nr:hypothetical protein [Microbulbifer sp. MLAF003]WHI52656.1 hypothetical protein P3339_07800 [Microbulbifer sp. MLAF003]
MKAVLCSLALILLTPIAYANSLTKQLETCSAIAVDEDRLACFDSLSGSLEQQAKQSFGQEHKATLQVPEYIEAKIAKIQDDSYGKKIITLDNGQIWKQSGSARIFWGAGDLVTVERAMLGSFFMKQADGGRKMRVKRVK